MQDGNTTLINAALNGHTDIVMDLLLHQVNTQHKNKVRRGQGWESVQICGIGLLLGRCHLAISHALNFSFGYISAFLACQRLRQLTDVLDAELRDGFGIWV